MSTQKLINECLDAARVLSETDTFPTGQAILKDAAREMERLIDGIGAIRQYGHDTLSGPTKRVDDTRDWQRESVLEMTNRSVRLLNGNAWNEPFNQSSQGATNE
jgi:hypothetical protein